MDFSSSENKMESTLTKFEPPAQYPKLILLISGKRKCGKDYITEKLRKRLDELGIESATIRIANPIKYHWAQKHELDYTKMLDSSTYKEQFRLDMVNWSVEVRETTYGYFPHEAILMAEAPGKWIWIIVDMRHQQDYDWFLEHYSQQLKRIRVTATEEIRKSRNWIYTPSIDEGPSEIELDHIQDWDLVVHNNININSNTEESDTELETYFHTIIGWVKSSCNCIK